MKVLVTCPPMLRMIDEFHSLFQKYNIEVTAPNIVQTLSVKELVKLVPEHDGWIIGDDPATREVFVSGKAGKLKAAVKWGIGVDNVDFSACHELDIPITNTPNMFGAEVADLAMGYVIALARQTFDIDRSVRMGDWYKPCGISLANKTVALIGYGDIGKNTARRLLAADMNVIAYDPNYIFSSELNKVMHAKWPSRIEEADFIVVNCSLNDSSYHMLNTEIFSLCKPGVRVVNVGRGSVIDEDSLEVALSTGKVFSAALDVFETEPPSMTSILRSHPRCVLGTHNASNTFEAVHRTSEIAIGKLVSFLNGYK